MSPKKN